MPGRRPPPRTRPRRVTRVAEQPIAPTTTMPAGLFKARCLELMDRVNADGGEIVITKYGRPVAKLVSARSAATAAFGSLRGTVTWYGDLISPVDETWEAQRG
jgi:prevent-host-death family protein